MPVNLFQSLHGYSTIEEENYLTESFVLVLRRLLELEPAIAVRLLDDIAHWPTGAEIESSAGVVVETQVTVVEGRPDIVLRAPNRLVYVEVKDGSGLGTGQLEYYWQRLQEAAEPHKRLVLLSRTRGTAAETTLDSEQFHNLCWFEVHAWLRTAPLTDPVARHYADEFVEFLEMKNMALQRVGWEYISGVPALYNLTEMLVAAADDALPGVRRQLTSGWGWRGIGLRQAYYCGIRYARPTVLVFENNSGTNPTYKRDLDLEATHFFALTADEQMHLLKDFLRQAYGDSPEVAAEQASDQQE